MEILRELLGPQQLIRMSERETLGNKLRWIALIPEEYEMKLSYTVFLMCVSRPGFEALRDWLRLR